MKIEIFGNNVNARVFMQNSAKPKESKIMLFSGYTDDARKFATRVADAINAAFSLCILQAWLVDHTKKEIRGTEWQFIAFDEAPRNNWFYDLYMQAPSFYRPACWKVADDVDTKKIADEVKAKELAKKAKREAEEKEQQELAVIVRRRKAFEQAREEVINACSILDCPYTRQDIRDRAEVLLREDSAR